MNKDNTNRIFYIICAIILGGIGFFVGGTYEKSSHEFERNRLVDSVDVKQAVIDHYEHNANYHAMFNYKAKEVTTNCNKCGPLLETIQVRLDSIEARKGELVVSHVGRNPSDRNVTAN
jgi:hypothetical protein